MTAEYRMSLTELSVILNYMNTEYVEKIPQKMMDFINENKDNSYTPNISKNIPINEQNLKEETKDLLSLLYRNYWCTPEDRVLLLKDDSKQKEIYEKELKEKYSTENLFKESTKKNDIVKPENTVNKDAFHLVEYKEKSIFSIIVEKIKALFTKFKK